jgi:hypothetical protein
MDDDAQDLQVRHVGRDGRRRYDPALYFEERSELPK